MYVCANISSGLSSDQQQLSIIEDESEAAEEVDEQIDELPVDAALASSQGIVRTKGTILNTGVALGTVVNQTIRIRTLSMQIFSGKFSNVHYKIYFNL